MKTQLGKTSVKHLNELFGALNTPQFLDKETILQIFNSFVLLISLKSKTDATHLAEFVDEIENCIIWNMLYYERKESFEQCANYKKILDLWKVIHLRLL